ncbi:hypothetical protein N865_03350 [Intrasporangium oryzae NRRL B-24470]|uniref:Uncharacterized protein n=1 Tax=Intrasporangium oryzae NRRL B-24470 TaxID=1386089 RepID=W9G9G1_9MICO|nr:hypothetical protein N865_03350 [Intrasporangium oryzae NRRL B-24470]
MLYAALRAGALAAVGTWSVTLLPALIGWVGAPESSLGWFSAVQVGTAIWFLGHGQSIGGSGVTVSVTPILLLLLFVLIGVRWVRRLVAVERGRLSTAAWSRAVRWAVAPGFVVGYVSVAALLALLTLGGPVGPGVAAVLGAGLVPLCALGFVLVRPDDEDSPAFVRTWFRRGPTWLPSVWRVGWRGAGALGLVGLAIVAMRVLGSLRDIVAVQGEYGANLVAGVVIVGAQLILLGNAAAWGLSFLAGPGFQLAVGGLVSPAAAHPGLMPLVPVLAALPDEADYPAAMFAVVAFPVVVGLVVARWVDAELEFFGNTRARATAMVTAVALSAAVVIAATWLGNGSIGVERLSAVGVAVPAFAGSLTAELVLGALLWLGARLWAERGVARMTVERPADGGGSSTSDEP